MGGFRTFLTGLAVTALLAGCEQGLQTSLTPKARPEVLPKPVEERPKPSARSEELTRYYAGVQADLLAQGLLRQDGGGIDTPFNTRQLAENFERIALYDEYARGAALRTASDAPTHLRRWVRPARVNVEFGDTVPEEIRATDSAYIADYAARLGRLTGHPVTMARAASANFHVLVMGEDDRGPAIRRIRQLVPNISDSSVDIFRTLPRSIHCLVVAFSGGSSDYEYRKAIAFVRAEHPDLMRRSCYHEEMAQGLGLANDSPNARPSIFNDDDEFALLTTHDELLLRMLYDTRLSTGMTPAQARPIVQEIAEGLSGGPS